MHCPESATGTDRTRTSQDIRDRPFAIYRIALRSMVDKRFACSKPPCPCSIKCRNMETQETASLTAALGLSAA